LISQSRGLGDVYKRQLIIVIPTIVSTQNPPYVKLQNSMFIFI
jgi:hypothetical protein